MLERIRMPAIALEAALLAVAVGGDVARDMATVDVEEPGEVPYFCSLHPDMRGVITVE